MRRSSSTFLSAPGARGSAALQLAWLDAAADAQDAYTAWLRAERADRADAFIAYQAALDREEAAARALELRTRACGGRLRSS
jgi:hypothetical protein